MSVQTYEGTVTSGRIALRSGLVLPERTKVFVIVPKGLENESPVNVRTPRLKDREKSSEFKMQMIEDPSSFGQ